MVVWFIIQYFKFHSKTLDSNGDVIINSESCDFPSSLAKCPVRLLNSKRTGHLASEGGDFRPLMLSTFEHGEFFLVPHLL